MALSCECASLDALLGGGLEPGVVTLVYGIAGSGKTNLSLQLARSAARADGTTMFLDTEGVSAERLGQLFNGRSKLQDRVLFTRLLTLEEQMHTTEELNGQEHNGLALVVSDSVNGLARVAQLEEKELCERQFTRILTALATLAHTAEVPVLITAQVWERDGEVHPFYQRSLTHLPKAVLKLEKDSQPNHRRAILIKHRSQPEGLKAHFEITQGGLV